MSFYYPQAAMSLRIRWEDFDAATNQILSKVQSFPILARKISVSINDYTQADTFSVEIDYKNFPFDPRCIRALGVTIHIQDMRKLFAKNNEINFIEPSAENTIFQGFADKDTISFDDTTRLVTFEGRDFTALLLDTSYDGKALDLGKRLDQLIQELLDRLPAVSDGKVKLDNRTGVADADLPTLGKFSPDFNTFSNTRSGKKNEKYWDVIQDLVSRAGLIAYIELDKLVITKPRALYADTKTYQFIYGKNLSKLEFDRKLGRQKGLNIVVRSISIETKETLEVKIPLDASVEWSNSIGVAREVQKITKLDAEGQEKVEEAPYLSFTLPNIKDTTQLREIGQGIWEELGRQQLEGSLSTKEMASFQRESNTRNPVEFDITKIRTGTPIQIEIDQGDMEGFRRVTDVADRIKFLKARGYANDVATALAQTSGKFATRFYTKSVEFTLDNESGFEMGLEFINFIEQGNRGL